jgi:F0F1-type ATP synthase epsilon subunit
MNKTFHLSVRTPESEILSQEVVSIKIGTDKGPMVVLPHHASLSGSVSFSRFFVREANAEREYLVRNGIIFVSLETNTTSILCYSCQEVKDIEYKTASEYLTFIEEKLKAGADLNDYQLKFLANEKIAMVQQMKLLEKK